MISVFSLAFHGAQHRLRWGFSLGGLFLGVTLFFSFVFSLLYSVKY